MKQFLDGLMVATIIAMCSHLLITFYENEKTKKTKLGGQDSAHADAPATGFTVKRIKQNDGEGTA
jgi:hypothetical protein